MILENPDKQNENYDGNKKNANANQSLNISKKIKIKTSVFEKRLYKLKQPSVSVNLKKSDAVNKMATHEINGPYIDKINPI